MATITINGHTFAETADELNQTGATGLYAVRKRAIHLSDAANEPMAVVNRELVLGVATRQKDGKVWYSYMPFHHILYSGSPLREREQLEALTKGKDKNGYFFK